MNGDDEGSGWCAASPLSATLLAFWSWNRSSVYFFVLGSNPATIDD